MLNNRLLAKTVVLGLLELMLSSCAFADRRALPYDAWSLTFFAPDYMEVWIETADAIDINNRIFRHAGSGIPALGYPRAFSKGIPKEFKGSPAGWQKDTGEKADA